MLNSKFSLEAKDILTNYLVYQDSNPLASQALIYLGKVIRCNRILVGYCQDELADKIGMSKVQLIALEHGGIPAKSVKSWWLRNLSEALSSEILGNLAEALDDSVESFIKAIHFVFPAFLT